MPFISHYSTLLVWLISQSLWGLWELATIEEQCPPATICIALQWRQHNGSAQAFWHGTAKVGLHRRSDAGPSRGLHRHSDGGFLKGGLEKQRWCILVVMLQNSLLNRQRHFNQEVLWLLIVLCIESEWEGVSLLWSLRFWGLDLSFPT